MPSYVFTCGDCGSFDVTRSMASAGDPASCPTCHREARRVFTPPGLARLATPVRRALDSEEASAAEPRVVTQKKGRPLRQPQSPAPPWVLHLSL